jgi:hypothetical protein
MREQSTDVPYNTIGSVYMTCRSVLDGDEEIPYNAVECAYLTSADGGVLEGDVRSVLPVIHTLDELDLPLHEYIRTPTVSTC